MLTSRVEDFLLRRDFFDAFERYRLDTFIEVAGILRTLFCRIVFAKLFTQAPQGVKNGNRSL